MRLHTLVRNRFSIVLAAMMLIGTAGFAQQAEDESWRDTIGPNDERVTGLVADVREDSFELQAHGTLYIFDIPSDPEQAADVRTGEYVQVWYNPEGYERDGDTYYRVSAVAMSDETMDNDGSVEVTVHDTETTDTETTATESTELTPAQQRYQTDAQAQARTETEVQTERDLETDVDVDADVDADASEDRLAASAELDADVRTDEFDADANEFDADAQVTQDGQVASTELETERELDNEWTDEREMDEQRTLPQTAGALPLIAVTGLFALFAAAMLRIYRS